ncbi:MAG: MBL fold metallo-hydrolase [Tannerellaceae bacterium]|jgi:glyoxylase-like metal-dependent hydrolase (beta-lactamase superfamily II)|nr:MBL fold metallo-hydrolase [Tannerellaceae bacterium]
MATAAKIELIETGRFYADGGAMFGPVPKASWTRRYPCNEANACILAMRTMLINDGAGRIVLVDNGAGNKQLRRLSFYKFFNLADLHGELLLRNIRPEQITDVVLTHLHFDHCGYTTLKNAGALRLAFPNALHWISREQWDICRNPGPLEKDSFLIENIAPLEHSPNLRLIDGDTNLSTAVSLRLFNGHTPAQIAVYAHAERTYVFAGDVIPLAAHISPDWISAYDMFPQTSYSEKLRMLEEATRERQTIVYCHDAYLDSSMVRKAREGVFGIDTIK